MLYAGHDLIILTERCVSCFIILINLRRRVEIIRYRAFLLLCALSFIFMGCSQKRRTEIEINDNNWYINNRITYLNTPVEGLLLNVRMVNSAFEDLNKGDIDPGKNTSAFISRISEYVDSGIRAFTLNLQGGNPGYEGAVNSAFDKRGDLRPEYMRRIKNVIKACDNAGACVILGCFYQRQDQRLENETAIRNAVKNTVNWIKQNKFKNVLLEIANEYPHSGFDFPILKTPQGEAELVKYAKSLYPELLVSTSGIGNGKIDNQVAAASDFILVHFNNVPVDSIPVRIKSLKKYNKPIVCNEDDKTGIKAVKAFRNSIQNKCSWGYMNAERNQYIPFDFSGAADDTLLYHAIKDITSSPLVFSGRDREILTKLENYVAGTLDALCPCSAGIVVSRGDSIIFEKYLLGTLSHKPVTHVDENSLWPMWSCTKSFISALLLSLVSDNIIRFDDPVGKYLPEFKTSGVGPYDRRKVTIRHLASHTSGVRFAQEKMQNLKYDPPLDLEKIWVETSPGKNFEYSSLGMHILERTIEAATGEDLYGLLQNRILKPLELKNAQYIYEYNNDLNILPCKSGIFNDLSGYYALSEKGRRCGTGLYMTSRELNLFGQLMLSDGYFKKNQYFNAEFKKEIWKHHGTRASDNGRYGLLWWLFEKEGGYVISGASYSVAAVAPDAGVVVTVTRNHTGPNPGPFNYFEDKKMLVLFAEKLGLKN